MAALRPTAVRCGPADRARSRGVEFSPCQEISIPTSENPEVGHPASVTIPSKAPCSAEDDVSQSFSEVSAESLMLEDAGPLPRRRPSLLDPS